MPYAEGTPTVVVTLGGNTYEVGYTWGVKRRIREKLAEMGIDPSGANQEEYLAITLWAGFDAEVRSRISVEDIEELINPTNEQEVVKKLQDLIVRSEPDPDPNVKPAAVTKLTAGSSESTTSGQLVSTT